MMVMIYKGKNRFLSGVFAILIVLIFSSETKAQDTLVRSKILYQTKYSRYVGFDINNMLSQVMPFNTVIPIGASPSIVSRRLWNGHGIRSAFGATYDFEFDELETLYVSFGYTSKSQISGNFYWIRGVDLKFILNEQRTSFFSFDGDGFGGISPYWGVEYQINEIISLSTETSLNVGASLNGFFVVEMQPPVHIQAHFNITRK